MVVRPDKMAWVKGSTPHPAGVTAPIPVTTTRRWRRSGLLSIHRPARARRHEGARHELSQAVDRREYRLVDLVALIVKTLRFEGLTTDRLADDTPLFGEGLGLDSVDALELVVALEKAYGITIRSLEVDKSVFTSVDSLG